MVLSIPFYNLLLYIRFLIFGLLAAAVYVKQDQIVEELLRTLNADFKGRIEINDSHVSPFVNFPYVSIDLTMSEYLKAETRQILRCRKIMKKGLIYTIFHHGHGPSIRYQTPQLPPLSDR